jgi:hypothetical protein
MQTRIPRITKELRRFVDAYGYAEWTSHVTRDLDFQSFMKGLEWFSGSGCPGTREVQTTEGFSRMYNWH